MVTHVEMAHRSLFIHKLSCTKCISLSNGMLAQNKRETGVSGSNSIPFMEEPQLGNERVIGVQFFG